MGQFYPSPRPYLPGVSNVGSGGLIQAAEDVGLIRQAETVTDVREILNPMPPTRPGGVKGVGGIAGEAAAAFQIGYMIGWMIFSQDPVWSNPGGWTEYICGGAAGGPVTGPWSTTFAIVPGVSSSNCIGFQAISGSGTALRVGFWWLDSPEFNRYSHSRSYVREAGDGAEQPSFTTLALVNAALLNGTWGRGSASKNGAPDQYPSHGSYGAPGDAPDAGATPDDPPGSIPGTDSPGSTVHDENPEPDTDTGSQSDGDGPPPPVRTEPPPRVRERKARLTRSAPVALVNWGLGQVTEGVDAMMCVHKALPPKFRAKPVWVAGGSPSQRYGGEGFGSLYRTKRQKKYHRDPTPLPDGFSWRRRKDGSWSAERGAYRAPTVEESAWAIWQNWDQIDLNKAVECLVANQIEDALLGRAGKKLGELGRILGKPVGAGAGPAL